jgi:REP element-mobilizing transposase RayT
MPTYTQIHIQTIFAVQDRERIIDKNWQERLYKYITAIIHKRKHKVLAIGGTDDHIHIFFGFRPTQSLSSLMQEIKRDSAEWLKQEKLVTGGFKWQEGYGAFSYSKSQIDGVVKYIMNQETHHKKISSFEEYRKILGDLGIDYDTRYLA